MFRPGTSFEAQLSQLSRKSGLDILSGHRTIPQTSIEDKTTSVSTVYFSGASGNLSMTYFPLATLMIGTPGIFRIRLFKSRSFVATI